MLHDLANDGGSVALKRAAEGWRQIEDVKKPAEDKRRKGTSFNNVTVDYLDIINGQDYFCHSKCLKRSEQQHSHKIWLSFWSSHWPC